MSHQLELGMKKSHLQEELDNLLDCQVPEEMNNNFAPNFGNSLMREEMTSSRKKNTSFSPENIHENVSPKNPPNQNH